jgi:predicted PurR-regulated permease PerM
MIVLAVLAMLAAAHVARDVLIPIAVAILLALLLRPLMRRMHGLRVPNLVSALVLVALAALVFAGGIYFLAGQAQYWLAQAPQTIRRVGELVPNSGLFGDFQDTTRAVEELTQPDQGARPLSVTVESDDIAFAVLGVSGHFIAASVIVFVLAYFLLAFSDTLLRQALSSQAKFHDKRSIVELVLNIENGISRYLLTITTINIGLGLTTALAMWALGMPNPILWGVMAATLNYVPHVGAFVCMVVLFFVGAVTRESLVYGGLVAGVFVTLTSVESYFITPLTLSKSLQLSPLAVILAILLCGWLWGIAGGLIAAPLLAIIKVVCDQFEALRPWAALLAGEVPDASAHGKAAGSVDLPLVAPAEQQLSPRASARPEA